MTLDLDALEALEKKATPGPWLSPVANGLRLYSWLLPSTPLHTIIADATEEAYWGCDQVPGPDSRAAWANVQFISALRNAFPEILRRLREADRNKDRWTALCNLWAASTAMELRQREDGRWEIAQIEPSENDVFRPLIGDDPDSVIDVALQERT